MNFRFTIGRKIGTGFGVLIFFIVVVFSVTINTVNNGNKTFERSRTLNDKITNLYDPSIKKLTTLSESVSESKRLIQNWVNSPSREDNPEKIKLKRLVNHVIPRTLDTLNSLEKEWNNDTESAIFKKAQINLDTLFTHYDTIIKTLPDMQSYDDPIKLFTARDLVVPNGKIDVKSKQISDYLDDLINRQSGTKRAAIAEQNRASEETTDSFNFLLNLVIYLGLALMVGAILIATFTTRSIVKPVHQLRNILLSLGKGVFPKKTMKPSNDEIGEMSEALNNLIDGLKRTTEFSKQVGSGNFDYDYQPLSNEDTLGHALLKMRDDLAENERILEQKVLERTEEVVRQRDEIQRQRIKVEELYKDVTDSIRYAKRLQDTILPPNKFIQEILPESFVLFKPKDIVSGDFYWMAESNSKVIFSAVDCTGHGVPGAFMSLVGANALNQAVLEHQLHTPAEILNDLNAQSSKTLNKGEDDFSVRDGMDLALCAYNKKEQKLEYAGANNPLYLLRNGEIKQIKADKAPIDGFDVSKRKYTNHTIDVQKGDLIYIFSDGYADQFGGSKGKKFMYSKFRKLLVSMKDQSMEEQGKILDQTIENWKGIYEQIDDILVIGVRIN